MFPFDSRFSWHTKTGYLHLVEAIKGHTDRFAEPYQTVLQARAKRTRWAVTLRGVVLVLLNLGLIATGVAWLATVLPILADIRSVVGTFARALTGLSLLLSGMFLLITRYLGQLQADIVAAMALGTGEMAWDATAVEEATETEEEEE